MITRLKEGELSFLGVFMVLGWAKATAAMYGRWYCKLDWSPKEIGRHINNGSRKDKRVSFVDKQYDHKEGFFFTSISTGLFLHPVCTYLYLLPAFAPLFKSRLVSDRSKVFCLLKPIFVKIFLINLLKLWRHENGDDVIKTSKSL